MKAQNDGNFHRSHFARRRLSATIKNVEATTKTGGRDDEIQIKTKSFWLASPRQTICLHCAPEKQKTLSAFGTVKAERKFHSTRSSSTSRLHLKTNFFLLLAPQTIEITDEKKVKWNEIQTVVSATRVRRKNVYGIFWARAKLFSPIEHFYFAPCRVAYCIK